MRIGSSLALPFSLLAVTVLTMSCGSSDEPYKPAPAWAGRAANLPAPPQITAAPVKVGASYTIAGASNQLRARLPSAEMRKASVTLVGYIVEENISTAPSCAIHKVGTKDPDDCPPQG